MSYPGKWRVRLRHVRNGFTLVEALVGLALLALTAALLPSALRLGLHAWTSRDDLDRAEALAMTVSALEQRISQAVPIFERDRRGGIRVLFEGGNTSLSFIGPAETGPAGAGVFHARLAPHASFAEGAGLIMELSPYLGSMPEKRVEPSSHLLAGPDVVIRFRYFGALKTGAKPQWHPAWRQPDELPLLVEVTAVLRTARDRHVHRQIIATRINVRS